MRARGFRVILLATAPAFSACGSNANGGTSPINAAGICADQALDLTGCSAVLSPSANDAMTVQAALTSVKSGNTVCLCPGTYRFDQPLTLTVSGVTLRGAGPNIDDATLDFSALASASDAVLVTADHFTGQNFALKNAPGNGVVVRKSSSPTLSKLRVSWDATDDTKHGPYALYPSECSTVLVEDCEASGAAAAAINVSQCTGAIVHRNTAHDSVLGIELENTTNGEAYDNETYNNAAGIAVVLLGNLPKTDAVGNLVHDNKIHDDNLMNFADATTVVASVPTGTGVFVLGTSNTEVRTNTITGNESAGILVVSYKLLQAVASGATSGPPPTNPFPDHVYVHDNTLTNNGTSPQSPLTLIGVSPLESVLWDGWVMSGMPAANDVKFCLGSKSPWPSFRMFAGDHLATKSNESTDPTPYECDLTPIAGNPP